VAYPETLGQYRLIRRIARGGMGEVWSAEPIAGGVRVAVKTLLSPEDADTMSLAKFIGEARIGAAVSNHPNIVKTIDLGLEGDRMFLVMELLDGRPLSQLIKGTQLPPEGAVGFALPVLDALEHAQQAPGPNGEPLKLVHRDLKPGNLFITRAGEVKVIDFGIALASGLDQTTTRTGLIRGSIAYVSPEQARGDRSDGRSDVYSLAVVMHELLTGKRLFDQTSDAARLSAILFGEVPDVRAARPDVPEALGKAIMHAIERDAAKRPETASAFAKELKDALAPKEPWGAAEIARWAAERPVGQPKPSATGPIVVSEASPKSGVPPLKVVPVASGAGAPPSASMAGLPQVVGTDDIVHTGETKSDRIARLMPKIVLAAAALALGVVGVFAFAISSSRVDVPPPMPLPGPREPAPKPIVALAEPKQPPPIPVKEPDPPSASEPAPAPAPSRSQPPKPRPKPAPPEPGAVSNATVYVTIDSRPSWANVSVDGKSLGPTPVVRVPLPVSSRTLTAVSAEGKKKTVKLKLSEGKDEKVLLEW